MDEMGIEEARQKLGDIVDSARLTDAATVITRYGKPAAVVVPYDWYQVVRAVVDDAKAALAAAEEAR